jgi:hypothetical protein
VSWSANFPEGVRGDHLEKDLAPEKAQTGIPETWEPHVVEQYDAARSVACTLIATGAIGAKAKVFSVSLSGHANPGHVPQEGWANDCITVSVSQRSDA